MVVVVVVETGASVVVVAVEVAARFGTPDVAMTPNTTPPTAKSAIAPMLSHWSRESEASPRRIAGIIGGVVP